MVARKKVKKKAKKAVYFPREPEDTIAARIKKLGRRRLLRILGPAYDLLETEPREHQLASLAVGLDNDSWLFALDMGLGKTKIAIDIYIVRNAMGEVEQCLVTCPPIVLRHWRKEVYKHSKRSVTLVEGSPAEKFHLFANATADIVVVSHPWLVRLLSDAMSGRTDYKAVQEACERFDMAVVDEAHALKNPASKGFEGYLEFLSDVPYFYELTGTPVGNDYTGVWSLYYLLDFGATYLDSFESFLRKFFYTILVGKRGFPINRLKKNMKEKFFDLFWTRAIRWEEGECADLPEREWVPLPLDMTPKQRQLYDSILAKDPVDPAATISSDTDPTWELLRVTGGTHEKLKGEKVPSVKLEALGHIIDEVVVAKNDFLLVWHWMVDEGELIARYIRENYPDINVGECRGNISKAKKDKAIEDWHAGINRITVANPGSIGQGIDLYEANIAVYYSNSRSQIHRSQSEKRIHRDGQTRNCWYYDLTCEDTIDEMVLEQLQASQDAFAGLTRDRAWKKLRKQRKK